MLDVDEKQCDVNHSERKKRCTVKLIKSGSGGSRRNTAGVTYARSEAGRLYHVMTKITLIWANHCLCGCICALMTSFVV